MHLEDDSYDVNYASYDEAVYGVDMVYKACTFRHVTTHSKATLSPLNCAVKVCLRIQITSGYEPTLTLLLRHTPNNLQ